ncbi:MAG: hypothetical protein Q9203_001998, partial [Teloschistes exilis]
MVLHNPNNWHWVNKDTSEWARTYLEQNLVGISAEDKDVSARIAKIMSMDGDVDVSQRKGKVITLFDVSVKLEFEGKINDDEDVTGNITIPEVAHDTELDEYVFDIDIHSDANAKQPVKDLIRAKILPELRQRLSKLGPALISEHGRDIQHENSSAPFTQHQKVTSSTAAQANANPAAEAASSQSVKNGPVVNTTTVNSTEEFRTTAAELYTTFTSPERLAAFTRAPPKVFEGAHVGGKFELFGGNVVGEFLELTEPSKIVQKWRLAQWAAGHYSRLEIAFDQNERDAVTAMRVVWKGVPVGQEEVTKRNWGEYYVRSIKTTFGDLDSASLTASVLDYEFENGRRYHAYKAGSYPLPNDEQELDRIDLKHHVALLLSGGHLHLAPLLNPKRILDIGTGSGVPENLHFEIDDCEATWMYPEHYFDYIHSRFMIASIGNWASLIRKAYKHTKPGGYFELQELDCRFTSDDGTLLPTSNLAYWSDLIVEAAAKYNRPIPRYTEYTAWFEKAGFTDIQQVVFKSPANTWPKDGILKEAGKYQLVAHLEGLEGISLGLFTRGLEWKAEEVKVLMAKIRPEIKNKAIHSYQTKYELPLGHPVFVTGRKPEHPPPATNTSRLGCTTPLTPNSLGSPTSPSSPAPPDQINAFTPVMPIKQEVSSSGKRGMK